MILIIISKQPIPVDLSNTTFNLIIGIATILLGILSFGTEIGEFSAVDFLKSGVFKFFALLFISPIIIWATIQKDITNDIVNSNSQIERDSTNQAKFNESLSKASSASAASNAQTMAKYYLKYDSVQHQIEKIVKDSTYKITKPELAITDIKATIKGDTIKVSTTISAIQGTVYHPELKQFYIIRIYSFSFDNKALQIIPFSNIKFRDVLTPISPGKEISNSIWNPAFLINKPKVYVFHKGLYYDQKGNKFPYTDLRYFDFETNSFGDLSTKEYNWIYDYIKKHS
jgi:hypothetical protein